ncbi:hypothetical protein KC316_g14386, partial [Hortaea werneckii]
MLTLIIALLLHQVASSDFQCPASNGLVVQDDYGVQYIVSCGTDADPGSYAGSSVFNNWNECFQACSTHSIDANGAGGPCNGFTYVGALNGRGGGSCYFKSGNMRFVGSGSGLISVATPERCPGCNIAGYANGTSPHSSSAAGVQTVSVTYTTIQTRTETATRYSTNTITTTGTVTTTAVSSYYTTAITTAVSTSRETLTTTTVQTTTQPGQYFFLLWNITLAIFHTFNFAAEILILTSGSVDDHLCLNIHDALRIPTSTDVEIYSGTTTVVTYTSVVPASTQTNTRTQTQLTTVTYLPVSRNLLAAQAMRTTFTTTSIFTSTYPVTATEATSFYTTSTAVSTYRTTATVTSVQPTTVLSTYVETVTSVQPASTIERTQTQQTTVRETSVAPGPTQTVTSTQLTTYVSTFTTSYPYTTTLPGATATTVPWATSTMRTTIVSTMTTTIQETLTQPGTTIRETTTQPGATVVSTLDRTVSGPTATYTTVGSSYGEGSVIYVTQTV